MSVGIFDEDSDVRVHVSEFEIKAKLVGDYLQRFCGPSYYWTGYDHHEITVRGSCLRYKIDGYCYGIQTKHQRTGSSSILEIESACVINSNSNPARVDTNSGHFCFDESKSPSDASLDLEVFKFDLEGDASSDFLDLVGIELVDLEESVEGVVAVFFIGYPSRTQNYMIDQIDYSCIGIESGWSLINLVRHVEVPLGASDGMSFARVHQNEIFRGSYDGLSGSPIFAIVRTNTEKEFRLGLCGIVQAANENGVLGFCPIKSVISLITFTHTSTLDCLGSGIYEM